MNEEIKIPKMATLLKAAELTGLSYNYLRRLCLTKQITFVKAGSKYLVNMDKLVIFLNGESESK